MRDLDPTDPGVQAFLAHLEQHGALTPELRARYQPRRRPAPSGNDLSPADLAAADVLIGVAIKTNEAIQELTRAIAAPQPAQPKSYRFTGLRRGEDGELSGDVQSGDGRVRHFHLSRGENGELEGDIEDLDGVEDVAPVPEDAEPATEATPGDFSDVFGSVEGP
jgi:hypothetical protein